MDNLHEKLRTKALGLEDDSNLSSSGNKALSKAIDDFDEFESSRYTSAEYEKAFNNLYMAVRLAEAEIAEKTLKKEFEFLGEDSPFAEAKYIDDVKNFETLEQDKEVEQELQENKEKIQSINSQIEVLEDYLKNSVVIVGAKSPKQVLQNAEALDWTLTQEQIDRLEKISKE